MANVKVGDIVEWALDCKRPIGVVVSIDINIAYIRWISAPDASYYYGHKKTPNHPACDMFLNKRGLRVVKKGGGLSVSQSEGR